MVIYPVGGISIPLLREGEIDYQIIIFLINFTTKFEAELFYFSFILHLTLIMGYLFD